MQFSTLRFALFAALAAAAPQPLLEAKDLRSCNNNVALSAVKLLRATAFCSSFLHISTETCTRTATVTTTIPTTVSATATVTNGQTATSINTVVVQVISTVVVDGPTNTITAVITGTNTITNPIVITVTRTNTVTSTTYARSGGPVKRDDVDVEERGSDSYPRPAIPPALKVFAEKVISTACSCYVTTPTVTKTKTVTQTIKPTATLSFTATVSPTIATVTNTVTSTSSSTTTSTGPPITTTQTNYATITATATPIVYSTKTVTETVTVPGRTYNYVASYNNNCVPYNYLTLNDDVPNIPLTFEGIFQYCANLCAQDTQCSQIWVAYNTPVTQSGLWCMTGGGGPNQNNFDYTWTSSEIQCQYPPIGKNGQWYSV